MVLWELQIYGQRELAKYQDNEEKLSKSFLSLFLLRAITLGISCLLFITFFCVNSEYKIFYRILVLEIISTILDISWLYQGTEDFKKITIRNFIIKITSIILTFTLVKDENDLIIYMLIYVLTNVLGNASLWIRINRYIDFKNIRNIEIKKFIRPAITMLIPQIASSIYTVLDKTMLGVLCDDISEVGFYEQAQKIAKISLTVLTAFNTVLVPKISKSYYDGNFKKVNEYMGQTFNFIWFLAIPMIFGIIAISDKFVPWFFGAGFEKVSTLLKCTTPIILFIAFSTAIGLQYLMSIGRQNIHSRNVVIGAILNTCINILLIPKFDAMGAIIASVIAEGFIAISEIVYIVKKQNIKFAIIINKWWHYFLAGIIMLIVTYATGIKLNATIITTAIQMVVGIVSYVLMLVLLKDEFFKYILNILKNKFMGRIRGVK